ncbi:MAG: hypothetical protein WAU02_03755 [Candidatus Saccharimonadales bacterium]
MKRNEIALLILITGVVALSSYFLIRALIGGGDPKIVTINKADPISASVGKPTPNIFNDKAYNPTIKIKIGDSSNQGPF